MAALKLQHWLRGRHSCAERQPQIVYSQLWFNITAEQHRYFWAQATMVNELRTLVLAVISHLLQSPTANTNKSCGECL